MVFMTIRNIHSKKFLNYLHSGFPNISHSRDCERTIVLLFGISSVDYFLIVRL